MYRLTSPLLVARVGRTVEASQTEAQGARWLALREFPAVRPADVEQPIVIDGRL